MSINQVLNVKDEITDGLEKFYITDNEDGTKNISVANVVESGTQINKILFDKIDNIMSYLTPQYEKVFDHEEINTYTFIPKIASVDKEWTIETTPIAILNSDTDTITFTGEIVESDDYYESFTPTLTVSKSHIATNYPIYARNSSNSTYRYTYAISSSEYIGKNMSFIVYPTPSNGLSEYTNGVSNGTTFIEIYDTKNTMEKSIHIDGLRRVGTPEISHFTVYTKVYTSNDNINWTNILDESESVFISYSQDYNINNITTRYIKVEQNYELNSTADDNVYFYKRNGDYITYYRKQTTPKYRNEYTLDNITTNLVGNQRVLINTSSDVEIINVINNSLNDIQIDGLLQSNYYYELVYDASQSKFLAKRVRN